MFLSERPQFFWPVAPQVKLSTNQVVWNGRLVPACMKRHQTQNHRDDTWRRTDGELKPSDPPELSSNRRRRFTSRHTAADLPPPLVSLNVLIRHHRSDRDQNLLWPLQAGAFHCNVIIYRSECVTAVFSAGLKTCFHLVRFHSATALIHKLNI